MELVKNLFSFKNFFSLKINNTTDTHYLIAKNNFDEDAVNVRIRVDGHRIKDGKILNRQYQAQIDSVKSEGIATIETLEPAHIHYTTDYIVTAVVKDSWVHHKFHNKNLENAKPYEKDSGDKGWRIPCVKKSSIPISKLLYVLCKDQYLVESSYKKSQFAKLVKKKPFTKLALVELYELVDHYHFGDGKMDKRKQDMVDLLWDVHSVKLEKTESNKVLMSQCLAGMDYFNMTPNQMAAIYMKLNQ